MRGYAWGVAIASMMGLIGCGEDDTYVYDVTLDAAALSNAPIECSGQAQAVPQDRAVEGLEAQQRWRFQRGDGEVESMSLEIPDVELSTPGIGSFVIDYQDDAPDVIAGAAAAGGGFQFLYLTEGFYMGYPRTDQAFTIVIETKTLDDTIQGFMWVRSMDKFRSWNTSPQCAITIPFTGKRVKE
ncbi:hypothetical protein [Myxococcus xanthus]|uniref:Lipoprotein n=2 Tax=Myxococcus xanthus TaxID=34 RepID=A0A7Y4IFJ9_MYXXA|nr:hypothetical protein [Myxococcus xanthus]NOJ77930.1 hypothetical protein [Myxococcus xanthus]NOJ86159.1 hypothetical protein [Myxococcus xanthus]